MATETPDSHPSNVNYTARLEAFSDGVFSIAITLLVFNIQVPRNLPEGKTLLSALIDLWPSYFAFVVSFTTIGIMWINHHNLFKVINRTDHLLLVLNALLLLAITFVNYPTAVLGEYIRNPVEGRTAALLYSGTFVIIALLYNLLWRHASSHRRLIDPSISQAIVNGITMQYRFGPWLYLAGFLVVFINVAAGVAINGLLALYFAIPSRTDLYTDSDHSADTSPSDRPN